MIKVSINKSSNACPNVCQKFKFNGWFMVELDECYSGRVLVDFEFFCHGDQKSNLLLELLFADRVGGVSHKQYRTVTNLR